VNVITTFDQYVYAVNSDLVHIDQLLPPEFPSIQICFRYDNFQTKFHRDCPGKGSWHGQISHTFELITEPISALSDKNQKNTFWCSVCDKGLFFPKTCKLHPDP